MFHSFVEPQITADFSKLKPAGPKPTRKIQSIFKIKKKNQGSTKEDLLSIFSLRTYYVLSLSVSYSALLKYFQLRVIFMIIYLS